MINLLEHEHDPIFTSITLKGKNNICPVLGQE